MLRNPSTLKRPLAGLGSRSGRLAACRSCAAVVGSKTCNEKPRDSTPAARGPLQVASVLLATCGTLFTTAVGPPHVLAAQGTPPLAAVQQHRQQASLPVAPALFDHPQQQHPKQTLAQQQPQQPSELLQLAAVGEPRPKLHWLLQVLWIGVLNIAGLWAVLQVLSWSNDVSTPVTVLCIRAGLRVDGEQLQQKLRFIRSTMMPVEHGMFFTYEEVMQAILRPPRGTSLAFADLSVNPLSSKHDGYDLFKKFAAVEQVAADAEEAQHVQHGMQPKGVQHRNPLQRLMGAAETQDVEESQACVVVSLVLLARGTVSVPDAALSDAGSFRAAMKQLSSHLSTGQLLAVELLITPDSPQDFLSEAQLIEDYDFLIDLSTGKPIRAAGTSTTAAAAAAGGGRGGGLTADDAAAAAAAAAGAGALGDGVAAAAAAAGPAAIRGSGSSGSLA